MGTNKRQETSGSSLTAVCPAVPVMPQRVTLFQTRQQPPSFEATTTNTEPAQERCEPRGATIVAGHGEYAHLLLGHAQNAGDNTGGCRRV